MILLLMGYGPTHAQNAKSLESYVDELESTSGEAASYLYDYYGTVLAWTWEMGMTPSVMTVGDFILDCVAPHAFAQDGVLPEPPLASIERRSVDKRTALQPQHFVPDDERCALGMVGVKRITIEDIERVGGVNAFTGPNGKTLDGDEHRYASVTFGVPNFGGSSIFDVRLPQVNPMNGHSFSLSQQWYVAVTDTGDRQTVEGGWQVYPGLYGTQNPTLFVFYTPDDYTTGCYNINCLDGFVPWPADTGTNWAPTMPIAGTPSDTAEVFELEMQWILDEETNMWWLYLPNPDPADPFTLTPAGYYPPRIYNGGPITQIADYFAVGGETTSSNPADFPQMGTGIAPFVDTPNAYQREIGYYDQPAYYIGELLSPDGYDGTSPDNNPPTCYEVDYYGDGFYDSELPSFSYGGPGNLDPCP